MDINVLPGDEAIDFYDAAAGQPPDEHGQALALRACLVRHYEALRRSLAGRLGCEDLATECLHDTWLRLGGYAPRQTVRDPVAYVYRIAYHLGVDRLRGDVQVRYADDGEGLLETLADPAPGPDAIVQARSDARELERALQKLPYRHGCVLFALRIEEKTRQEVADWLCVSVRNVDTMLRQTYQSLAGRHGVPCEQAMLACLAREAGKGQPWRLSRNA